MTRRYFGTDGIRATVGQPPMTPDFVLLLGQATARVLRRRLAPARVSVLIGKDPRVSGYMLEAALQAGFSSAGVNVKLCGPLPTPGIAYLTRALRLDAGVVISASHNPYQDNGIKFFSADGRKLPDELEAEIEEEIGRGWSCQASDGLGKAQRVDDAAGRYIEFCKSSFPGRLDLKGLRLYLDCANGASYHVAPRVFHELGAEVRADAVSPNGFNINAGVGATHSADLSRRCAQAGCDYGIAFDGDADRVIMADGLGHVYNGDELLYVIVRSRLAQGPVAGVVGTLMSNLALERRLSELGVPLARAKVGDRYVMEELCRRDWLYGGETSGHIILRDRQTTGDGIVSALQALAAVVGSGHALSDLLADLTLWPQVLLNLPIRRGWDWRGEDGLPELVERAQAELGERGRLLIRPSGTEPLLRLMVEAEDGELAERTARWLAEAFAERVPASG